MGASVSCIADVNAAIEENKWQVTEIDTRKQWKSYFEALKGTDQLLVIDFSATWCGPCKHIEPKVKEFAAMYSDVLFFKIDVDNLADLAKEFKVEALPAFIFVKRGKEVNRTVGAMVDALQSLIEKHGTL